MFYTINSNLKSAPQYENTEIVKNQRYKDKNSFLSASNINISNNTILTNKKNEIVQFQWKNEKSDSFSTKQGADQSKVISSFDLSNHRLQKQA